MHINAWARIVKNRKEAGISCLTINITEYTNKRKERLELHPREDTL
jgi:hypothetical protein